MGRVITVGTQKGGCSKTTTCIEVGACLAQKGKRVLLIDLDQQCNLSTYVNADLSKPSIKDLLDGDCGQSQAIQNVGIFDVISASPKLSRADREYVGADDNFLLADVVDDLKGEYDYILCDTGAARNILLTMCYCASDYIIIPCGCDDGSLMAVDAVASDLKVLRESKRKLSHAEIACIILSPYSARTGLHRDTYEILTEKAAELAGQPFVGTVRQSIAVSEAKTARKSTQEYDKKSNAASDFRNITEMILEKIGDE